MIREIRDGVTLAVRAQPGAKKTAITGVYGDGPGAQLKIAVHAPPVDGRANESLIAFLSGIFCLQRSNVVLVSGEASRSKIFFLKGANLSDVNTTLVKQMPPA